jgi:hypothetical protein
MAKLTTPTETAAALGVSERMLLFCVASNTDWKLTTMVVKGLITRDALGHLVLTDRGRAVLRVRPSGDSSCEDGFGDQRLQLALRKAGPSDWAVAFLRAY